MAEYKAGDLVTILYDENYVITKKGTQWVVFYEYDENMLMVGELSSDPVEFKERQSIIMNDFAPFSLRHKYDRKMLSKYLVSKEDLVLSGSILTNRALAKDVLNQSDIWEFRAEPVKKATHYYDNDDSDLPF